MHTDRRYLRCSAVALALGIAGLSGCLDSTEDDFVGFTFGVADPATAPRVDSLEDYDEREPEFTRTIEYVRAFANGQPIWFWSIDGANSRIIAPAYRIVDAQGNRVQTEMIIDVLPGDTGYTPWWRVIEYVVTDRYDGEVFTSREALDGAAQAGLLQGPNETTRILNGPVSLDEVLVQNAPMQPKENRARRVWYRGLIAHWVVFDQDYFLDEDIREMPIMPVYVLQRIDQPYPLDELGAGIDLNEDLVLNDSNNIFSRYRNSPMYTPLWFPAFVRTRPDYVSIDTAPPARNVGFDTESDVYDAENDTKTDEVLSLVRDESTLLNCPIQLATGEFK